MGEHLLRGVATPLEVAVSTVGAARRPLPADLVKTVWNPETCPLDLLPILANQLSVDVWDDAWDEAKKRRVIRRAIPVQKIKGTLAALKEYASYRDATITRVIRPPQRFFASAAETPEGREAWVAGLPQIRLHVQSATAAADRRIIAGGGTPYFLARRFAIPSTAATRAGERAVFHRDGIDTPIGVGTWNGNADLTISAPGRRLSRLHAGVAGRSFASPSVALDHVYRITFDASADLAPIAPGARLQTTRVEIRSTPGLAGWRWWAGARAHHRFALPSTAATRVFRRIPIIDDTVAPQPRRSISFASLTRLGVPPHTAELGVDIPGRGSRLALVAGVRRAGLFALPSRAAARIAPTFAALVAAKRLTDTLYVDTNLHRPLTVGTPLFVGTTYRIGQWTRS